jgi:hypothetical protein
MQKKGGSQTVGRSRNYAFGKPGSMEPDFELNLGPPAFWRNSHFPRWSGLLCEHRGIAEHHLRSQEAQDAYISHCVSFRFDLLTFLILLPPRFPPASMIETKAESQNYLANPYSSLGPLPFHTDEYVLSVLPFRDVFFSPVYACHLSNGHERGVIRFDGQKPLSTSVLPMLDHPPDTIHQLSPSPCIRSALIPVNNVAD